MTTIYLCGAINGCSDMQAKHWRELAKQELAGKYNFLDPMRRDYRGRELEPGIPDEIVAGDEQDIRDSSIILANGLKPTWGTAMEIRYAATIGKHVVTVCPDEYPSPWLKKHSAKIFKTWAEAYQYLNDAA